MNNVKNFWHSLITPHSNIEDEEIRINSRLLSILLAILLPVATIYLISLALAFGDSDTGLSVDLLVFGILVILLGALFWVNRLGYFHLAIMTILILGSLAITLEAYLDRDTGDLAFLLLPMIIASLFLSRAPLFILGISYLGAPVLLIFLLPREYHDTIIKFIFPLLTIGIILNIISRFHRDYLEKLRKNKIMESELRYSLVADAVNDGIWDWDLVTNRVYYSSRWKEMIGYSPDELSDSPDEWLSRIHPNDLEHAGHQLRQIQSGGPAYSSFEVEYQFRHRNNNYIWVLSRGRAIHDKHGIPIRSVGSHTNITSRKQAEEKLSFDALHDVLTGLANRALFNEKLSQVIKYAKRDPSLLYAVLFLDLDNFKDINDSMGHNAGDEILKEFTTCLKSVLFDVDTLARLGGDEFVILLESLDSPQRPIDIVHRIRNTLIQPFTIDNADIYLTTSIGVLIGTQEYTSPEEILRDADIAMYHAKNLGRDTFEIFNAGMREQIMNRVDLERDLRQAIQNEEFFLEYQPITHLNTSRLRGFEALIRWNHPSRGLIFPAEFIPIAEQTGLIIPIGEWVFRTACRQLQEWEIKYPSVKYLTISINVSGKQLTHANFRETVESIMTSTNLDPHRINLEITETVILEDNPDTYNTLVSLAHRGFHLQLDDFGKGQSSLGYLQKYPLSELKIDRSFVSLLQNKREYGLIQGIIQLASALELGTVAEGIESIEQEATLKSLDCTSGQGFGISKPVSAGRIDEMLKEQDGNSTYIFPVKDFQA